MSAVIRLGYVNLRVTDLEEARNHYSNTLGWSRARRTGTLHLQGGDEWDFRPAERAIEHPQPARQLDDLRGVAPRPGPGSAPSGVPGPRCWDR